MAFDRDIRTFATNVQSKGTALLQSLTAEGVYSLIKLSQVETGNFRSYWRVGVNTPVLEFDHSRRHRLLMAGHGKGKPPVPPTEALNSLMQATPKIKLGDVVYITNDTSYGLHLNRRRPMLKLTLSRLGGMVAKVRP